MTTVTETVARFRKAQRIANLLEGEGSADPFSVDTVDNRFGEREWRIIGQQLGDTEAPSMPTRALVVLLMEDRNSQRRQS